jgi:peptidoglycan hydrolase-like protein with peptidoglycan-binding domain
MTIQKKNTFAKVAATIAGLSLVATLLVPGAQAQAQTTTTTTTSTTSLQAQIASLLAQIAQLQAQMGTTVTTSSMFTMDLTISSRGAQVTQLQNWLISKGYSIPAGATGYFGTQTRAAVASFQVANGISPTAGYFGPITRARVNAMIGTTATTTGGTTTTTTTTVLSGNGRLVNVSSLGDITSDLHEGDSVTKVAGVSLDARDGDVRVQRMDVQFNIATGTNSSNLDKYLDTVSVYLDGKKLGSMDASAGDKDGRVWTLRFADLNGVIKNGNTGNLYVEVTPVSSIGSSESGKTVTAIIPTDGVRAVGSDGISETYVNSQISEDFTVTTATNGNLTITAANDNPANNQVAVSTSDTTSDVTLLRFNLKAKNQDADINDIPVTLTTSDNNLNDVISTVRLMKGSTVLKSKTVSTGSSQTIVFDNLNQTISQDNTNEYTIEADLKSTSAYAAGTTITASVLNSGSWDASDVNGNTVSPTGSAVGGTVTLNTTGISVAKVAASTQTTTGLSGGADTTQYAITFKVTAGDDDLFIGRNTTRLASSTVTPTASAGGIAYATTTSSTFGVTDNGTTNFSAADTNNGDTASAYKIPAGTSRTFTLNVSLTATSASGGFSGIQLVGVNYSTTSTLGTLYFTSGLDTIKTQDVFMKTR